MNASVSRSGRTAAWLTLGTLATYLGWLGWDQPPAPQDFDSPHVYAPWQIVGLAVTLAALTVAATWLRHGPTALIVVPTTFIVAKVADAVPDAWFWPLDVAYAGLGCALVVLVSFVNTRTVAQGRRARVPTL